LRIQREAIERNIEALDAAQQASRQEAARRNGRIGGQVYNLQRVSTEYGRK
jgi:outer membrane murein-binding lipoprotein Lpp